MKIISKVIFSAALAVFGVGMNTTPSFAAGNRINPVDSHAVIIPYDDTKSDTGSVDPAFKKFSLTINAGDYILDDNYIDIETHALPEIINQDIYSSSSGEVVIGKIYKTGTIVGNRKYNLKLASEVSNYENIDPSVNTIYEYRITFNKNASDLKDITIHFNIDNKTTSYSISSKQYTTRAWVKINDSEIASKELTIPKWGMTTKYSNILSHSSTRMGCDTGYITSGFLFGTKEDLVGSQLEISVPENSYYNLISAGDQVLGSNFIYDNTSTVNDLGFIFSASNSRKISISEVKNTATNIARFNVTSMNSDVNLSGLTVKLELTDLGKKYFTENGKFPSINYNSKIIRDKEVISNMNQTANVKYQCSNYNFSSETEKPLDNKEEMVSAEELTKKSDETPTAPNTGFETSNALAVTVAGFSTLSTLGFMIFRKK